jgi:predicted nucleic acid-binding protein
MSDNNAVYLDTSALAKWYLSESNSEQVSAYIVGLDIAIVSTLTKTEMRCLLARRKRTQEFDANV